jgi:hypothetical protein
MGTCLSCLALLETSYTNYSRIENPESSRSNDEPEFSRQFQFDHSDRTSDVESTWQNFPPSLEPAQTRRPTTEPSLQYFVGQAKPTHTPNPDELSSNGFENIPISIRADLLSVITPSAKFAHKKGRHRPKQEVLWEMISSSLSDVGSYDQLSVDHQYLSLLELVKLEMSGDTVGFLKYLRSLAIKNGLTELGSKYLHLLSTHPCKAEAIETVSQSGTNVRKRTGLY